MQRRQRNVQEKCDERANMLFCLISPLLFDVLVAVAVVVAKAPYCSKAQTSFSVNLKRAGKLFYIISHLKVAHENELMLFGEVHFGTI